MKYDDLVIEAENEGIEVIEKNSSITRLKGLYFDGIIAINAALDTEIEKKCVLAEEIGHYHTSCGDILVQNNIGNKKQEKRARNWAYERLVPLDKLISAYNACVRNHHELAGYLDVTEGFVEEAVMHYKEKYGKYTIFGDYIIFFDPLGVLKCLEGRDTNEDQTTCAG